MPWSGEVDADVCLDCRQRPTGLEWCESWGHYRGGVERLVHAFKFARHHFLERHLALLLAERLIERRDFDFDALVPVPMHRSKLRRRGYNQAALLGSALSRRLGIPCQPLLSKIVEREPQSTLARSQRAANVRNAFRPEPAVAGLSLLLVDDVATTGETLRACARTLIASGARRVCAITVARA
jgi:competence protein ComFC